MRHYLIPVNSGQVSLLSLVRNAVNSTDEEAELLIRQGSVYSKKIRLKDPCLFISDTEIEIFFPEKPVFEYSLDPDLVKYEDDDLLLVYKQPGINTCPSPFSDWDCLSHGVEKYLACRGINRQVSIIHRLDRPAQGLVFFGKNKQAEIRLHEMFRLRKVKKLYLAQTENLPNELKSSRPFRIKDNLVWRNKEKPAISFIKFLGNFNSVSYFAASPFTGRPHQLRKHFSDYLAPIIGDAVYGGYPKTAELKLTAFHYRFTHPMTGKKIRFEFIPEEYKFLINSRISP